MYVPAANSNLNADLRHWVPTHPPSSPETKKELQKKRCRLETFQWSLYSVLHPHAIVLVVPDVPDMPLLIPIFQISTLYPFLLLSFLPTTPLLYPFLTLSRIYLRLLKEPARPLTPAPLLERRDGRVRRSIVLAAAAPQRLRDAAPRVGEAEAAAAARGRADAARRAGLCGF